MSSNQLASVAFVISLLSFVLSALTYYRNSAGAQLRRDQITRMRVLAGRAIVLWDQLSTLITAQARKFPVDPYIYPSFRLNVRRLEEALDDAIGIGLLAHIIGTREHSLAMHGALRQSLTSMEAIERPEDAPIEEWTKLHFVMGMIRLLDVCVKYKPSLLPATVCVDIERRIGRSLEEAYTYLRHPKPETPAALEPNPKST